MVRQAAVALIRVYQKTLSPDYGWRRARYPAGYCKFSPTCSVYCARAIEKHGVLKGGWLGIKRVFRCNPWSKGGEDPVRINN